jgi:hypothetical protein
MLLSLHSATRFIELLAPHPYFELHVLAASSRSAGQEYAKVTKWKLKTPIPEDVKKMIVQPCTSDAPGMKECGVVFSGLDHDVAGDIGRSSDLAVRSVQALLIFRGNLIVHQRLRYVKPSWSSSRTPKTTDVIPLFPSSYLLSTHLISPSSNINRPVWVYKRDTLSATPIVPPLEWSLL